MNLFELIFIFGVVCLLWLASKFVGHELGVSRWLVLSILTPITVLFLTLLFRRLRKQLFPECENGKCDSDDYSWEGIDHRGEIFKCRCGRRYFWKGNRFFAADENDQPRKYKVKPHFYSRWTYDGNQ